MFLGILGSIFVDLDFVKWMVTMLWCALAILKVYILITTKTFSAKKSKLPFQSQVLQEYN